MLTKRQQEIVELTDRGCSNQEIADKIGITYQTVRSHKKAINKRKRNSGEFPDSTENGKDEKFTTDFKEDVGTISSLSHRLKTVDDVLSYANIDKEIWEVDRVKTNYYEMGRKDKKVDLVWDEGKTSGTVNDSGGWNTNKLWQISIWLKKKLRDPVNEAIQAVHDILKDEKTILKQRKWVRPDDPHLLEVSLVDHHFGKLAIKKESLKESENVYLNAIDDILHKTEGYDIDRIVFPLGSDFFHINNMMGTTKRGTKVDISDHLFDIFNAGCIAIIKAIYKLRSVAPIDILWVPGNHDFETSRYLLHYIDGRFRDDKNINVDLGVNPRKYINYGVNLIGYAHGNEEKLINLPNIMMTENKKNIQDIEHFEWHIGHQHRKKEMKMMATDTMGHISIKTLPSLSSTDYWHLTRGFLSDRLTESYLYSKENGPTGYFISHYRNLQ